MENNRPWNTPTGQPSTTVAPPKAPPHLRGPNGLQPAQAASIILTLPKNGVVHALLARKGDGFLGLAIGKKKAEDADLAETAWRTWTETAGVSLRHGQDGSSVPPRWAWPGQLLVEIEREAHWQAGQWESPTGTTTYYHYHVDRGVAALALRDGNAISGMETVLVTGEQLTRHPLPCGSDQRMLQTAFERAWLFEHSRLGDSPEQPSTPAAPHQASAQPPEPAGLPPAQAARVLLTVRSEGGAVYALLVRKGDDSLGLTIGMDRLEDADLAHTAWENWEETADILLCARSNSFSMPNCWARPGPSPHAGRMDSPAGANIYFRHRATQEHPHPLIGDQRALQEALEKVVSAEQRRLENPQRGGATPQTATPGVPPQEPPEDDPFAAKPQMRTVLEDLEEGGSCAERYRPTCRPACGTWWRHTHRTY